MIHELGLLREAVRQAGERVLQLAREGFETQLKGDRSPVTSADLEVNRILEEAIRRHFPEDGWMSEETPDNQERLEKKRVWIVDPIDGTKYFMRGIPQYAISAALAEEGMLTVALVYNPASGELFTASRGGGAYLNEKPIHVKAAGSPPLHILVGPPAHARGRFQPFEGLAAFEPKGSIAYTLGLVAAGRADATLNLDHLSEWDIAAGVLLVEEAGGTVVDSRGAALVFNKPSPAVRGIIAGHPDAGKRIQAMIEERGRGA